MEYNQWRSTVSWMNLLLQECNLFLINVLWTREARSWWPFGPHCRIRPSETRPSVFSSETCHSVRRKWTRRNLKWRYELSDHLILEVFAAKEVLHIRCFHFHWCLHRCIFVPNSFDCLLCTNYKGDHGDEERKEALCVPKGRHYVEHPTDRPANWVIKSCWHTTRVGGLVIVVVLNGCHQVTARSTVLPKEAF